MNLVDIESIQKVTSESDDFDHVLTTVALGMLYEQSVTMSESSVLLNNEVYSLEERRRLLELHRSIASEFGLNSPYFDLARSGETFSSDCLLDQEIKSIQTDFGLFSEKILIGNISDFPQTWLAAMIQDQVHAYITQDTMGEFPQDDSNKVRELLAEMINGFVSTDVFVSFQLQQQQDGPESAVLIKPFAGAKLVFGSSESTVMESNGATESTIPTLAALKIKDDSILSDFGEGLADTPELSIVCASRLYSTVMESIPQIRSTLYPTYTSAYLALAAEHYSAEMGTPSTWLLFDTHHTGLMAMVQKRFNGKLVAANGQVEPTELVSSTTSILHYHYLGMTGKIHIGAIPMEDYSRLSKEFLETKKLPLP